MTPIVPLCFESQELSKEALDGSVYQIEIEASAPSELSRINNDLEKNLLPEMNSCFLLRGAGHDSSSLQTPVESERKKLSTFCLRRKSPLVGKFSCAEFRSVTSIPSGFDLYASHGSFWVFLPEKRRITLSIQNQSGRTCSSFIRQ